VLVVDDERLIRQSLGAALVQEGFDASVAGSAAEAWQRFGAYRPALVLLDLKLGDDDGLALLARMRAAAPSTRFIVVTAHASPESESLVASLGALALVRKPFELDELLAIVKSAGETSA